ncbi:MAG: hypothetical protein WKF87_09665 [Chryseolinea sp.]
MGENLKTANFYLSRWLGIIAIRWISPKLVYSNHPIYQGKKEVTEFLKDHVTHLPVFEKLDIRNDRIDNLGEYVVEYASHIAMIRNGDWSGVNTGKNITIWKREKDCSLKIFRGMAMYD